MAKAKKSTPPKKKIEKEKKEKKTIKSVALLLLRVSMGWFFLHAGLTKVLDPNWTSAGFLQSSITFPVIYDWFAASYNIGWVDLLNQWGLTLVGAGLITGAFTRVASCAGIILMVLYYFPTLVFGHC